MAAIRRTVRGTQCTAGAVLVGKCQVCATMQRPTGSRSGGPRNRWWSWPTQSVRERMRCDSQESGAVGRRQTKRSVAGLGEGSSTAWREGARVEVSEGRPR